ncbi:MAG: hypothetical protein GVY33_14835, partial [Alphaproteobacteria bacterium]|nr:hypothetical protein [Alphaproteobacteria bacterium]
MASFAETPIVSRPLLTAAARGSVRAAGGAAFVAALALAVALGFHDPADPSWNQATAAPVSNPLGAGGAVVSDLLFQLFGHAAWLAPLTVAAWAMRVVLLAPHPRPLLPFTFLPLALLAVPAALADHGGLAASASTGLPGGLVGYELWTRLALPLGGGLYALVTTLAAVATTLVALGLRPLESLRAARLGSRVTAHLAAWTGGRLQAGGAAAWHRARTWRRPSAAAVGASLAELTTAWRRRRGVGAAGVAAAPPAA